MQIHDLTWQTQGQSPLKVMGFTHEFGVRSLSPESFEPNVNLSETMNTTHDQASRLEASHT